MYTAGRGVERGGGRMPNVYKFKYTRSNAGGYSSSTDCGSISQPTLCKGSPLKIHVIQATTGEGIHTCSSSRNPIFSPYAGQTRICSPCCNNAPPTPTLEEDHRIVETLVFLFIKMKTVNIWSHPWASHLKTISCPHDLPSQQTSKYDPSVSFLVVAMDVFQEIRISNIL